ncbi:MAG: HD domain-containing protein [Ruminococcaceae bacterium]|nr:HD domain-containing protein [Oscillospiraceae bacterium]
MIYREIAEAEIEGLRERVRGYMSEKRYLHTLAVEDMAARLSDLYCPEKKNKIRAAALLHDITKELSADEHLALCKEYGETLIPEDVVAPKTLHARTAAIIIPMKFPEFSDIEIINAVRFHTTGCAYMTLCEKIIYLSDYIDDTRTHWDCIKLRNMFWDAEPQNMNAEERIAHLDFVVLEAVNTCINSLIEDRKIISCDTVSARNSLLLNIK